MDPVVTARVASEIRKQGNGILASIGSTPTELVNAAYEYVIENGCLPRREPSAQNNGRKRRLSEIDEAALAKFFEDSTCPVDETFWQGKSYKELIAEGRLADYETLA